MSILQQVSDKMQTILRPLLKRLRHGEKKPKTHGEVTQVFGWFRKNPMIA